MRMPQHFTTEERTFITEQYFSTKSYLQVCASFAIRFPDTKLPFKSTIKRIVDRFRETGSVNDRKKQIKPRKITAEKIKKIKEQVIQNDGFVSVRDLSKHENIGLSPSSVHTVLKEHLKIHPYKPTKEHKHLLSSDLGKRRQFCQWSIYEVTDDGKECFLVRLNSQP